jgi:hypothetical protein
VNLLNFNPYAAGVPHFPVSSMATGVMGFSWLTARAELQAPVPIHEGLVKATGNPFFVATSGRASIDTRLISTPDFSLRPAQVRPGWAGSDVTLTVATAPR